MRTLPWPFTSVLLDVVPMNPRVSPCGIARLKENILFTFARQEFYARGHYLFRWCAGFGIRQKGSHVLLANRLKLLILLELSNCFDRARFQEPGPELPEQIS